MHPAKFMGQTALASAPVMSDAERLSRLEALGNALSDKRREAVDARKASGIEEVWLACEEAYVGIDDANRHEFKAARWAKPMSMSGSPTEKSGPVDATRSTAFVRLTARYVDHAGAKLGEILLPIDDKAFSFEATPVADPVLPVPGAVDPNAAPVAPMAPVAQFGAPSPQAIAAMPQPGALAANPADQQQDAASAAAKRAEQRVYDWMTEAKYPAECRKVIHDAARIGVGVLKGPFPDVQENRAAKRINGGIALEIVQKVVPSVRWVDPWNVFPDDACGEDIHNGDFVWERDFLSKKSLAKLAEQEAIGYLPEQIKAVLEEGPGKCYSDGTNPAERRDKDKKRFEVWYYYGIVDRADMEAVNADALKGLDEDTESVHAIVTMVNDRVIRAVLHPLESGKFPYRVMGWSRRAGHWAGIGVGEQMSVAQRSVNAATRAMFNNAGIASGVQVVIDQSLITPADNKWVITPNKIWYTLSGQTADVTKAFQVLTIPSLQADLSAIIQYGMRLAEESTGIPLVTQGQAGPTTPQTFGQAELQDNNAHTWLRSIGYRFDDDITEPLVQDFYEWLLLDPEVPDDEKGDFRINAQGSVAMVERAIQEQFWFGVLSAVGNPAFMLDPSKVMAQLLKAKRINPKDAQYSEAEQAKMRGQPPAPPVQVMVKQVEGQNKLQQIAAQAQADAQVAAVEAEHEQQLMMQGGIAPHQASAIAQIEREKIRANASAVIQQSRADAELARADKEQEIAQQNAAYDLEKLRLLNQQALIQMAEKRNITLEQAKAELAKVSMQEETKRQLGAAELQLAASQGNADRAVDLHKHHNPAPSLVRDEVSTESTP
jgi:hypothetical protein